MINFSASLTAWKTPDFEQVLKHEIEQLNVHELPLQQALAHSSYALDTNLNAVIISADENDPFLTIKAGIFYSGLIAGCNCADDPTPADEIPEYCQVLINIDVTTALAVISLIADN